MALFCAFAAKAKPITATTRRIAFFVLMSIISSICFYADKNRQFYRVARRNCAQIEIIFHFCGGVLVFVVFLHADISREFGTTIRQVRAEAYRLSTTAARVLRQALRVEIRMREHRQEDSLDFHPFFILSYLPRCCNRTSRFVGTALQFSRFEFCHLVCNAL